MATTTVPALPMATSTEHLPLLHWPTLLLLWPSMFQQLRQSYQPQQPHSGSISMQNRSMRFGMRRMAIEKDINDIMEQENVDFACACLQAETDFNDDEFTMPQYLRFIISVARENRNNPAAVYGALQGGRPGLDNRYGGSGGDGESNSA
ncbi:MAG: hypothetical protein J3R72DRAFT_491796 [Linnemannia gamsii]|nr:MAG: hypothetical protein J3R72DRAFT_491796 [Linnemannia gamsii]